MRRSRPPLTLALALVLAAAPVSADSTDDYVARWMALFRVPGVAIAVVRDGQVVKMQGYGLSNREAKEAVTTDTVFKIGSISKQFIATGIMRLVRDRRIGLDDAIGKYLVDAPTAWRSITVRQLLSHTAGLRRESPVFDGMTAASDIAIIRGAYPEPLLSVPGTKYAYSNVGYYVLAELISQVSGEHWSDYIARAVFAPAGLRPIFTTNAATQRAAGYSGNDNSTVAVEWRALRPSGAFMTTITQLAKWDAVLQTDQVLTQQERDVMISTVPLADGTSAPYGFGWHVERFNGHRYIWHGGGLPGFSAIFARFPDQHLTVIALSNGDDSDMGSLMANLALIHAPALASERK